PPVGEPAPMQRSSPDPTLLQLLIDHLLYARADPVDASGALSGVGTAVLDVVQRLLHDVCRHETGRERARRKLLERQRELEDVVHRAVYLPDMIDLPVPEGVRRDV